MGDGWEGEKKVEQDEGWEEGGKVKGRRRKRLWEKIWKAGEGKRG